MCKAFKVSRSGYYGWLNSEPSKRAIDNREILQEIRLIHKESGQTYGSPRISKALKANNMSVSRPRVARLMKQAELRAKQVKRFKITTDSKHSYPVSENLLDRNFTANAIGKVWVSDITYIRTITGWLYLTVILDLADRKIIGFRLK
jgi:transposase InsO family protein